jgi:hypothetical protein
VFAEFFGANSLAGMHKKGDRKQLLQALDLLKSKPEELTNNLSCAEMAVLNVQSDLVNFRVAAEAADYLYRMVTGNLKRFATYFDLESGTARSVYITQQ